ncbi:MAG: hypothetical protein MJZ84_08560 [Paludibacteraceae bacterium]|nr:hypothetical protein [Paludibacteraceae bacterium]
MANNLTYDTLSSLLSTSGTNILGTANYTSNTSALSQFAAQLSSLYNTSSCGGGIQTCGRDYYMYVECLKSIMACEDATLKIYITDKDGYPIDFSKSNIIGLNLQLFDKFDCNVAGYISSPCETITGIRNFVENADGDYVFINDKFITDDEFEQMLDDGNIDKYVRIVDKTMEANHKQNIQYIRQFGAVYPYYWHGKNHPPKKAAPYKYKKSDKGTYINVDGEYIDITKTSISEIKKQVKHYSPWIDPIGADAEVYVPTELDEPPALVRDEGVNIHNGDLQYNWVLTNEIVLYKDVHIFEDNTEVEIELDLSPHTCMSLGDFLKLANDNNGLLDVNENIVVYKFEQAYVHKDGSGDTIKTSDLIYDKTITTSRPNQSIDVEIDLSCPQYINIDNEVWADRIKNNPTQAKRYSWDMETEDAIVGFSSFYTTDSDGNLIHDGNIKSSDGAIYLHLTDEDTCKFVSGRLYAEAILYIGEENNGTYDCEHYTKYQIGCTPVAEVTRGRISRMQR